MSLNTFKTTNFYMKHRFRKFTEQVYSTEIGYKWRNNNVIRLIYLNEISPGLCLRKQINHALDSMIFSGCCQ